MKPFNQVIIVGTGLIGASLGLNLIKKRLAKEVIGVGRHAANLRTAKRIRAIHTPWQIRKTKDLFASDRLLEADLIVLATPVQTITDFLEMIPAPFIKKMKRGMVITDVGSTKRSIVRLAERRICGPAAFVGGHPIAGTERSGAQAAQADLFKGRVVLLTPTQKTARAAMTKVRSLWRGVGSQVMTLSPAKHDRLLALTSHLPHVVAYSLIHSLSGQTEATQLAGGGLRDFTRIAVSDPTMWRDICLENRDQILKGMDRFEKGWKQLKRALVKKDAQALQRFFQQSRAIRQKNL